MPESDLTHGRIACSAVLRELLCNLAAPDPSSTGPGDVLLIDSDFADWSLNDPAVMHALQAWMKPPGRRLRIVGLDFEVAPISRTLFQPEKDSDLAPARRSA